MMINIKYCKICKRAFDINTIRDICPECYYSLNKEVKKCQRKQISLKI